MPMYRFRPGNMPILQRVHLIIPLEQQAPGTGHPITAQAIAQTLKGTPAHLRHISPMMAWLPMILETDILMLIQVASVSPAELPAAQMVAA